MSPFQAAFVPGRSIQENVILGQEVLHTMKTKKGRRGMFALKLDMKKAYDRMEWGFILQVVRAFGFGERWVRWIEQCISAVSFSVMINGSPFGFFKPERGLRQGDPLSPFLFILGAEVLSQMLARAENEWSIFGIKVALRAPPLSHLLFADDLMIFGRAKTREANRIVAILENYSTISGQRVNKAKSALFCSKNSHPEVIEELGNIF